MRMEQYLQCIDYTLWEIVENGNEPIVTKIIDGKETIIPHISVEVKAQRRAELKAISTLLLRTDLESNQEEEGPTNFALMAYSSTSSSSSTNSEVSESEEEDVPKSKTVNMFNKPSFAKINFVKSAEQVNTVKETRVNTARPKAVISAVKGNK
ncbi:hypothetical protein Tco_0931253, partial [Tanacetum coccineum]